VALWIGNSQQLHHRFEQLLQADGWQQDSRLVHWRTGWRTAQHFWRAGSGLGSYRFVYEPFEDRNETQWYHHAENQYLEAFVELGVIGPSLLIAACVASLLTILGGLRKAPDPETYAFAITCGFALISQVVQAALDFGLYQPANAVALAVLCGAANLVPPTQRNHLTATLLPRRIDVTRTVVVLLACSALLAAAGSVYLLTDIAVMERIERHGPDPTGYDPTQRSQIQYQIEQLQQLTQRHPADARAHALLAQLWTLRYRTEATRSLDKQLGGNADVRQLWAFTDPVWMHARVYQLERDRAHRTLDELRAQPALRNSLGRAFEHLLAARHLQPMRAKHELAVAELLPLLSSTHTDEAHIDHAVSLAPSQADVLFRAGVLHLQAERWDRGLPLWRRCLALSREYRQQILELGPTLVGPVDFFEQLFQGLPEPLVDIAFERYGSAEHLSERLMLAELAETQLSQQPQPALDDLVLRARIAWLRDDFSSAEKLFRDALQLAPDAVDIHYHLARVLMRQGNLTAARQHAARCLAVRPTNPRFRKLMQDLRAAPR
jgi:tetratricopeptide (TPR) repeat protein